MLYFDISYIFWDESIYMMGGKALAGQPVGYTELDFRPPLLPVLIAPFSLFSGYYAFLSKLFMIFLNTVLVIVVYILGKQFSKQIGLLSAFLAAVIPYHLISSSWVMTDGSTAILLLATMLCYFKGFKQNKNNLVYLGGFFLALAILMKLTNLLLLILIFPLVIFNLKKIKVILKSFFISFIAFSPYLIINQAYFGNPLHGALKAFQIGNIMLETVGRQSFDIILKVFYDFFGLTLSAFIFAGVILFAKEKIISEKKKEVRRENFFWIYCFFIFIPYYVYLVHEGATPIWWDPQRFLLSFLPFGLLFSTYFITRIANNFSNKTKIVILTLIVILIVIGWSQQYVRFAQPAINYEDGLRQVTKQAGLYLKNEDIDSLLCLGNCPPIAYYSDKKLSIVYDIKDFELTTGKHGIIFSNNIDKLRVSYESAKTFCEDKWCVYVLKNSSTLQA